MTSVSAMGWSSPAADADSTLASDAAKPATPTTRMSPMNGPISLNPVPTSEKMPPPHSETSPANVRYAYEASCLDVPEQVDHLPELPYMRLLPGEPERLPKNGIPPLRGLSATSFHESP